MLYRDLQMIFFHSSYGTENRHKFQEEYFLYFLSVERTLIMKHPVWHSPKKYTHVIAFSKISLK